MALMCGHSSIISNVLHQMPITYTHKYGKTSDTYFLKNIKILGSLLKIFLIFKPYILIYFVVIKNSSYMKVYTK